jgi:protein-S-isoprenylcysteine O-methyltransferase Ste14
VYSEWIRRHRRTIGIPIVLTALFLAKFEGRFLWISIPLVGLGEAIRIWAAGHLRKEQLITTGGPYRIIRNPLYIGSFLIAIGFCTIAGSIWIWLLAIAYFAFCYLPVIQFEENTLQQKFGANYSAYASVVHAFRPGFHLYPHSSTEFSWKQAFQNKEYNALIGILAAYVYLLAVKPNLHP